MSILVCVSLVCCKRTASKNPGFEGVIVTIDSSQRSYLYEVRGNVARRERQGSKSYAILTAKGSTTRVKDCPFGPMTFQPPPDRGESFEATSVEATGGHDVVAGLACDIYRAKSDDATATVCATADIAPFVSWGHDAFPLRMSVDMGGQSATTSVTRVERKTVDPKRLEVPTGAKLAASWDDFEHCR